MAADAIAKLQAALEACKMLTSDPHYHSTVSSEDYERLTELAYAIVDIVE